MFMHWRRDGTSYPEGQDGLMEWGKDLMNPKIKIVKQETLPNGYWVSTVWLGLDHRWGKGQPLIFETMVFYQGESDLDMQRYSTEAEAIVGHKALVKKWSRKKPKNKYVT